MSAADGHRRTDAPRSRERLWPYLLVALLPAAIVAATDALALVLAKTGSSKSDVERTIVGLAVAVTAAGVLLALMPAMPLARKGTFAAVLICATVAAAIVGFAVWAEAISIACHGAVDCPLG